MNKTFKELKEISQNLADKIGIDYKEAAAVVASFSAVGEWDQVDKIKAGDNATITEGIKRVGLVVPDADNIPKKTKSNKQSTENKKTVKKENKRITPPVVQGVRTYSDSLEDYRRGELPETLTEDIKTLLHAWAEDNGFDDLCKLSNIQWSSACLFVGVWIKQNKILEDIQRERAEGGKRYDGEKVAAFVPIWQYITGLFGHIPLHVDFISFSGVSRQWFYDYDKQGLTSTSVQIIKKVMEIENNAITAAVNDSRQNPTGRIFYAKARLGWRENDSITQLADNTAHNNNALPVFDLPKLP